MAFQELDLLCVDVLTKDIHYEQKHLFVQDPNMTCSTSSNPNSVLSGDRWLVEKTRTLISSFKPCHNEDSSKLAGRPAGCSSQDVPARRKDPFGIILRKSCRECGEDQSKSSDQVGLTAPPRVMPSVSYQCKRIMHYCNDLLI